MLSHTITEIEKLFEMEWKRIEGFPRYEISMFGEIRTDFHKTKVKYDDTIDIRTNHLVDKVTNNLSYTDYLMYKYITY